MIDRVAALARIAAALGDPRSALGARAREVLAAEGPLSAPMAEWALRTSTARYTPLALAALAANPDLVGEHVALVLAASVPIAPLRALTLPLLRGAAHLWARPSRHQPAFATLVGEALAAEGLPIEVRAPGEPGAFLDEVLARGAGRVIAYGTDASLRAIAARLPADVAFEGRGHGFGVGLVRAEALADADAAERVARDVAHYDQLGCLSPQCVLVEGDDARPFAARLAAALAGLADLLPRAPLPAALAARVNQWQGAQAAAAAEFHRGRSYAVAAMKDTRLVGSPGARNVAVVPAGALAQVFALLAPVAAHLTCVGVAGDLAQVHACALLAGAAPRVVVAGTMQDPPLEGPEDPRPLLDWRSGQYSRRQ